MAIINKLTTTWAFWQNKNDSIGSMPALPKKAIDIPLTDEETALKTKNENKNAIEKKEKTPLKSKINRVFWTCLGGWSTYKLADSGLANFLALETLNHGTGPFGYAGINLNGADPNFGGSHTGSSVSGGRPNHILNSKNFFHVFKDSEDCGVHDFPALCSVMRTLLPRMHAVYSGMSNFGSTRQNPDLIRGGLGAAAGFFTPTLKFRFTPEEVLNCSNSCIFENDPDYGSFAYRTHEPISANHIGMTGSLTQGINSSMFARMLDNPGKVAIGVALLGAAVLMARKTYKYAKSPLPRPETAQLQPQVQPPAWKDRAKKLAITSGWVSLAITTIFLNTL